MADYISANELTEVHTPRVITVTKHYPITPDTLATGNVGSDQITSNILVYLDVRQVLMKDGEEKEVIVEIMKDLMSILKRGNYFNFSSPI